MSDEGRTVIRRRAHVRLCLIVFVFVVILVIPPVRCVARLILEVLGSKETYRSYMIIYKKSQTKGS